MHTATLENQLKPTGFGKNEFEETADQAMQIVGVLQEADLSEYIPHGERCLSKEIFFRMKEVDSKRFADLIRENIIEKTPRKYSPTKIVETSMNFKNTSIEEIIKFELIKWQMGMTEHRTDLFVRRKTV